MWKNNRPITASAVVLLFVRKWCKVMSPVKEMYTRTASFVLIWYKVVLSFGTILMFVDHVVLQFEGAMGLRIMDTFRCYCRRHWVRSLAISQTLVPVDTIMYKLSGLANGSCLIWIPTRIIVYYISCEFGLKFSQLNILDLAFSWSFGQQMDIQTYWEISSNLPIHRVHTPLVECQYSGIGERCTGHKVSQPFVYMYGHWSR